MRQMIAQTSLIDNFLQTIHAESTRQTKTKHLRIFERWLRGRRKIILESTEEDLRKYHSYLSLIRKCSPRSISSYFTTLRQFFRWMKDNGLVWSDPTSGIDTKRRNIIRLKMSQLQLHQYGLFCAQKSMRDYLMFVIMVLPGLTPKEVAGIRLVDIKFGYNYPRISLSSDQFICINHEILPTLRNYINMHKGQIFLFEDGNGKPLSEEYIRRVRRNGIKTFNKLIT